MTPTVIRFSEAPGHLQAVVVTVIHSKGIDAYFHVYKQYPNGRTTLEHSGGSWSSEQGAVAQWEEWCAEHPWLDDGSELAKARRTLDNQS